MESSNYEVRQHYILGMKEPHPGRSIGNRYLISGIFLGDAHHYNRLPSSLSKEEREAARVERRRDDKFEITVSGIDHLVRYTGPVLNEFDHDNFLMLVAQNSDEYQAIPGYIDIVASAWLEGLKRQPGRFGTFDTLSIKSVRQSFVRMNEARITITRKDDPSRVLFSGFLVETHKSVVSSVTNSMVAGESTAFKKSDDRLQVRINPDIRRLFDDYKGGYYIDMDARLELSSGASKWLMMELCNRKPGVPASFKKMWKRSHINKMRFNVFLRDMIERCLPELKQVGIIREYHIIEVAERGETVLAVVFSRDGKLKLGVQAPIDSPLLAAARQLERQTGKKYMLNQ